MSHFVSFVTQALTSRTPPVCGVRQGSVVFPTDGPTPSSTRSVLCVTVCGAVPPQSLQPSCEQVVSMLVWLDCPSFVDSSGKPAPSTQDNDNMILTSVQLWLSEFGVCWSLFWSKGYFFNLFFSLCVSVCLMSVDLFLPKLSILMTLWRLSSSLYHCYFSPALACDSLLEFPSLCGNPPSVHACSP